ncbi:uncharacterized protein LOC139908391 [Centroberyx gerrardi]
MHPELKGIANLKVIRAMGSLLSKGFVRETFAWKHAYYYLNNDGIVYLRDYLRLPPEIMPASLQRVRRPTSTLDIMRRAARVQTVEGPTSYVPKSRGRGESQAAMMDRQSYRHRRPGEEEDQSDRRPMNFRGSYQPQGPVGQPGVQTQTFFRRGQGFRRGEERGAEDGQRRGFRTSYLPPEDRAVRCPVPVKEAKPPTPSVPVAAPVVPEIPKQMPMAQQVIEPAVEPVTPAPSAPVEEVVQEAVEEIAAPPPAEPEEPESIVETDEEVEEAIIEEPAEELVPDVTAGDVLKPDLEEPAEVIEEVVPGEHVEEDPQTVPLVEEPEEEEEEVEEEVEEEEEVEVEEEEEENAPEEVFITDMVVVQDTPEETVEEEPYDVEIEIPKDPKQLEVEVSIPVTEAETPESYSDFDSPTPPPPVTDDFTDLTEETVVGNNTADDDFASMAITQEVITVMEEAIPTQVISQSHVVMETSAILVSDMVSDLGLDQEESAAFEADCPAPVVPSECPIAALKSSLPQGDWGFLTEDPEEEQEVKKVWPDSLEG